jgi:N-methylhydantoinase A
MNKLRIGVDTGGTFTDFVLVRDGRIEIFKELSTPQAPENAIMNGIDRIQGQSIQEVIHGSTVATNALLERKGARTALLTTEGFEDVIVIGRQTRRELYNVFVTHPAPLVSETLRLGVRERILHDGTVECPLDIEQVRQLIAYMRTADVQSIAICLLFSFANDSHEKCIEAELKGLGLPVSLSSRVLPEYREYERTSTTVINAYLAPLMSRYLTSLQERFDRTPLRVMQSNGGVVHASTAAATPVKTILSGPAGGVVGAFHVAMMSGYPKIITFDMGGTSTDVSLCEGDIKVTHEGRIDGMPVGVPIMDIHTVGAGGGSIAELDPGGALKVGPESAGAVPGPICYGRGDRLTVTDANVVLGRLLPRFFLGGQMRLAVDRIEPAIRRAEWTRQWRTPHALAQGIIDIVNNNMEQAIRLISVERGYDPREFTLVCFGGAGGLHAASIAKGLGIRRVVVPLFPGALSALGLLLADVRKDYSRTLLIDAKNSEAHLRIELERLHRAGMEELGREGFSRDAMRILDFVDMRYRGQSYELTLPTGKRLIQQFHRVHERRFGYASPGKDVEIVNVRSTFLGRTTKPKLQKSQRRYGKPRPVDTQPAWLDEKRVRTPIYDRSSLAHGHVIQGPAIIGEYSSTTLVPRGFRCRVDPYLNLVIEK